MTDCLEPARAQRRETMDRLRHEELVLENAKRKQRAAERSSRIREKQIEQESKPGPLVMRERKQEAGTKATPKEAAPSSIASEPRPSLTPRISEAQARRNKEAFDAKQKQATEHRADVERRNAERLQKSKPVPALPVPKGASAP